jgi:cobalt-zinc-cadmium resistance protein CzcA
VAGTVIEENHPPGARLLIRGPASLRRDPEALCRRTCASCADGQSLSLASVATIERVDGPVKVDRENAQRYSVDPVERARTRSGRLCR